MHVERTAAGSLLYRDVSYHLGQPTRAEEDRLAAKGLDVCEINQREGEPLLYAVVPNRTKYFLEISVLRSIYNTGSLFENDPSNSEWVERARNWFARARALETAHEQDNVPNDVVASMRDMVGVIRSQLGPDSASIVGCDVRSPPPVPLKDALVPGSYVFVAPRGTPQFHLEHTYYRFTIPRVFGELKVKLDRLLHLAACSAGNSRCRLAAVYQPGSSEPYARGSLAMGPVDELDVVLLHLILNEVNFCGFYGCVDVIECHRTHRNHPDDITGNAARILGHQRLCSGNYLFVDSKLTSRMRAKGTLAPYPVQDFTTHGSWCTCEKTSSHDAASMLGVKAFLEEFIYKNDWDCRVHQFHYTSAGAKLHCLVMGPLDHGLHGAKATWGQIVATETALGESPFPSIRERRYFAVWAPPTHRNN